MYQFSANFEDKRQANFNKGEAELERRRAEEKERERIQQVRISSVEK